MTPDKDMVELQPSAEVMAMRNEIMKIAEGKMLREFLLACHLVMLRATANTMPIGQAIELIETYHHIDMASLPYYYTGKHPAPSSVN